MRGLPARVAAAALASGLAALIYELLLFERASWVLGSSLRAGALVLGAWMGGMALGALLGLPGRWRGARPRSYRVLEVLIALLGAVLLLGPEPSAPWLAAGGVLMALAIGLTTPLLSEIALPAAAQFRRGLRLLYAANTAGAVLGVLLGLALLRLAGWNAALAVALAGNLASALLVRGPATAAPGAVVSAAAPALGSPPPRTTGRWPPAALLAAVALLGFALLWLEMLALRSLPFFARGTALNFALVVAVVIAGLSLGAARPAGRRRALVWAPLAVLAAPWALAPLFGGAPAAGLAEWLRALLVALLLLGPAALFSGALYTALAERVRRDSTHSARALGLLAAANAAGAAGGALLGGLWLLPAWGLTTCGLVAGLLLALLAPLLPAADDALGSTGSRPSSRARRWRPALPALLLALLLAMSLAPLTPPLETWRARTLALYGESEIVASRQAADADLVLARRPLAGGVLSQRLLTDGYSMANTAWDSQRYMRLFAALPQRLHPQPERALLISYGLGTTADQLLADARLRALDIVDTSAATLALAAAHVDAAPLQDARSAVHIEDGRHWLRRAGPGYDLITAEPPPPRLRGIQRLYSREYFALVHARLRPGGLASHWLPVDQLSPASSRAVVAAFCQVFADCSLWAGSHYNWMLLGSRGLDVAASGRAAAGASAQPAWRGRVARIGLEQPWQWPALFLADAAQLRAYAGDRPPLEDRHPGRLGQAAVGAAALQGYADFAARAATRYRASPWARSLWGLGAGEPAALDPRGWLWQPLLNGDSRPPLEALPALLTASLRDGLRLPALRLYGLSPRSLTLWAQAAPLLETQAAPPAAPLPASAVRRTLALELQGLLRGGAATLPAPNPGDPPALYALREAAACLREGRACLEVGRP